MKYFIGVVPPADISETVFNIQQKFGDNRLEPHITIRPPITVADKTAWIKAIETVCSAFSPIPVSLPDTGSFGNRVLFIDVVSQQLAVLHDVLISAVKPFEEADERHQERQLFKPHLTLGRSWCGFTRQDFAAMKVLADDYLSKESISFNAEFVRVYHKPSNQGRYETLMDVPLGGQR